MISKKVVMLGMWGVGKTSLVQRFVSSIYDDKYMSTIGVKVDKKVVSVNHTDINLMLWDVAGTENHFSIPLHYIKGASGYLLVIDGTRPTTLEAAVDLISIVKEGVGDIPFIAVVNKSDLQWELSADEISQALGDTPWYPSSAKTGDNVEQAFQRLAEAIVP